MNIRQNLNSWRAKLRKPYKLVVIDDQTMIRKRVIHITGWKILSMLFIGALIVSVFSILLATQTRLITFLGPLPKALVGRDYKDLSARIDSMEILSAAREQKLQAIQKLITAGKQNDVDVSDIQKPAKEIIVTDEEDDHDHDHEILEDETALLPLIRFSSPVKGEVTSGFDAEHFHMGIDLAAKANSEIRAAAEGIVIFSKFTIANGYTIWILHPSGYKTSYKHNSLLYASIGQTVSQGEIIAIIGNTGESSTGPHLHFELWRDQAALDPGKYIKF